MTSVAITILLLLIGLGGCLKSFQGVAEFRTKLRMQKQPDYFLPAWGVRLQAMEFKNLAADWAYLKGSHLFSDKRLKGQPLSAADWKMVHAYLDRSTQLDPYFIDPYYFGQGILTWEAGMIEETNALLERGWQHHPQDYVFPFFIGFNHFYFRHDYAGAARYLKDAARIPGSSHLLKLLSSRMEYQGGETESAILFLREMLIAVQEPGQQDLIRIRLRALERVKRLEDAVSAFQIKFGHPPQNLEVLVNAGIIDQIPPDPYGGRFYLDEAGRIQSTSRFSPMP